MESKYKYNNMDPLTKAYLKIITESSDDLQKGQTVQGYTPKEGQAFGNDGLAKKIQKKTGPESVDGDVDSPEEAPAHLTQSKETDGEVKPNKVSYESMNPFDRLYNKIISEEDEKNPEGFSFETDAPKNSDFSVAEPFGDKSSESTDEFGETDKTDDGDDDKVTLDLDKDSAHKLLQILAAALGAEVEDMPDDSGDDSGDDLGDDSGDMSDDDHGHDDDSSDDEEVKAEAVDMEKLAGEKGLSLTDKSKFDSKGVKTQKKSATVPNTGKGHDGELKAHSTEGGVNTLTSKGSMNAGGVNIGDFFNNK